MVGVARRGWLERYQGLFVALAILALAAVVGLALVEMREARAAREGELERVSELLGRQVAALERQSAIAIEQARQEVQPVPRIVPPQPFETVEGRATTRFAASNSNGPAREARLHVVLLCCAHLQSLAAKPESAVLYRFDATEPVALLPAGETLGREVAFEALDHPVRVVARERASHKLSAWVGVSYREPLALGDGEPGRETEAASYVWDGALWRWTPATADEHRAIEGVLRARGELDGETRNDETATADLEGS